MSSWSHSKSPGRKIARKSFQSVQLCRGRLPRTISTCGSCQPRKSLPVSKSVMSFSCLQRKCVYPHSDSTLHRYTQNQVWVIKMFSKFNGNIIFRCSWVFLTVAGEKRELTRLMNYRNNFQEIREHICEIAEKNSVTYLRNTRKMIWWEKTESAISKYKKF